MRADSANEESSRGPAFSRAGVELEGLFRAGVLPADAIAVMVVGSVARGWANALSDYDLNIVAASRWSGSISSVVRVPLSASDVPCLVVTEGEWQCEIKYWEAAQIEEMMAKLAWARFESSAAGQDALSEDEELFLERVSTCRPLLGREWVDHMRERLDATAFRALLVTRSLAAADAAVEDAEGQLEAGDMVSAVLSARKALGHAVDALLESHGNYGSRTPKWRGRRFAEANPEQLSFADYWDLETMRTYDPKSPVEWVSMVLSLCFRLTLEIDIR